MTDESVPVPFSLEKFMLSNIEEMAFAPSEWEARAVQEVSALPSVVVTRPAERQLLDLGMVPQNCHANCAMQEANDPERQSRHVVGWYVHASDLILHSVVEMCGQWFCLTPQLGPASAKFEFIPDDLIEWRHDAESSFNEAYRQGVRLPFALRRYPEDHIKMRDRFRALVETGMSISMARNEVEATLGEEIRNLRRVGSAS